MSIQQFPAKSALAAALALSLLLGGCSSAPKKPTETAGPESNEPDLVAQLRERMASGNLPRKAKVESTGPTAVTGDTSSAPTVTVDPVKQQAAMAVGADYARALGLMKSDSDAEALALLRQISTKVPQFSGPLVNQGVILLKQKKYAEAETALKAALKANPRSPYANNLLGIALREQGKFIDAKSAYQAALALDPNYAKAHFNLGVLADLYMQELPLALSHYEKYQALQSKADPAVANWIIDLQKRTGVYKAPPRPAPVEPVAMPDEPAAETAPATEPQAPATDAAAAEQKSAS
jgi:tetratricopeptide (TPR) repeat protein